MSDSIADQIIRVEVQLSELPDGLRAHITRARVVGRELSDLFGVDHLRVDLALVGHDLYRASTNAELLDLAARRGIVPGAIDREQPLLLHGPLAAIWMADKGHVTDKEVLDAVRHHTTFAPGLKALAATVFLADKLEPDKLMRRPSLAEVNNLAWTGDWKSAVSAYIRILHGELKLRGLTPHPLAQKAQDDLSNDWL